MFTRFSAYTCLQVSVSQERAFSRRFACLPAIANLVEHVKEQDGDDDSPTLTLVLYFERCFPDRSNSLPQYEQVSIMDFRLLIV